MPKDTASNKKIDPHEKFTKFKCFNCGEVTIWRSYKNRVFVREYTCPKCGFVGP
ncbi:MAG: zinc finger domain-containing protein [Thermoproteota archaeon]|nr:DUF1610 domain-containing protein [Candidatus Brockarchaeota archaeon]MBO3768089.1 DUF1610 domain-containing protein [Candidatus Brockarchaeota archaeon]MBO3801366.1 DUF1610 domain-containing protein [Candidatus Brockarchaeota archaeon]